ELVPIAGTWLKRRLHIAGDGHDLTRGRIEQSSAAIGGLAPGGLAVANVDANPSPLGDSNPRGGANRSVARNVHELDADTMAACRTCRDKAQRQSAAGYGRGADDACVEAVDPIPPDAKRRRG